MQNKKPYNEKRQPHGYWVTYKADGKIQYEGNFINGILIGFYGFYANNQKLKCKEYHAK
jgi:antitoxin component YwqK of YwqJK toxin-antitoxin module